MGIKRPFFFLFHENWNFGIERSKGNECLSRKKPSQNRIWFSAKRFKMMSSWHGWSIYIIHWEEHICRDLNFWSIMAMEKKKCPDKIIKPEVFLRIRLDQSRRWSRILFDIFGCLFTMATNKFCFLGDIWQYLEMFWLSQFVGWQRVLLVSGG